MKRKYELNLDALIVIALLFALSLGMNAVLYRMYSEQAADNIRLQIQGQIDELNLTSKQAYIDKLEASDKDG